MRPFAAGLVSEILALHPSIPYGTNNNRIFPNTFFQNFTVAPHPCCHGLAERTYPKGQNARKFLASRKHQPNGTARRVDSQEGYDWEVLARAEERLQ
jgi:hypothetical protein